jgi:hypothetical protein
VDLSGLDHSIEPRLNQVTLALLTIIQDEELRQDIRAFIREYNRQLVVDRSMTLEALVLETLIRLHDETQERDPSADPVYSLTDLAKLVTESIAAEADEKDEPPRMTAKKVGYLLREKLQLRTEKRNGRFHVVWDERSIAALKARYGLEIGAEA